MLLAALPAAAQAFDPPSMAKGWVHQDRDFSFTFFDAASRSLITWDKGFGIMNTLSLAKLDAAPSMWFMDRYNNAWVISGDILTFITKDGKVDSKEKLPAPVADVAWDSQSGFVLLYRTATPYLEMRNMKNGNVLWSHGIRPKKGESVPQSPFRVCLKVLPGGDTQVFYTEDTSLDLTVLAGKTGDPIVRTSLKLNGQPSPALDFSKSSAGTLCSYIGKTPIYESVDSTALPAGAAPGLNGLLLAKMDLDTGTLSFQPTGLTPDNEFIGVVDGQGVFVKPGGGLVFVPVP